MVGLLALQGAAALAPPAEIRPEGPGQLSNAAE
jgi:hypothetical protein